MVPKMPWAHLRPPDGTASSPRSCHHVPPWLWPVPAPEEMLHPPPLGPTLVQRNKAGRQDEGHSPGDALAPLGQGTEGCLKPGCPIPRRANVLQEPACAEEVWGAARASVPGASGGG